jgi:hypothetical protein
MTSIFDSGTFKNWIISLLVCSEMAIILSAEFAAF